jgi:hypothetical protein
MQEHQNLVRSFYRSFEISMIELLLEIDFDFDFLLDPEQLVEINKILPSSECDSNDVKVETFDCHQKISKKRKCNPDSAVIAAVTAETLKSLELDPNSKDGKQKKRQIRNRMSAQYHRDRKNAYILQLEQTLTEKLNEIRKLQVDVNALVCENSSLRAVLGCSNEALNHCSSPYTEYFTDSDDSQRSRFHLTPPPRFKPFESLDVMSPSVNQFSDLQKNSCSSFFETYDSSQAVDAHTSILKPVFGLSPISRSLAIISMMCVISIMLLGSPSFDLEAPQHLDRRLLSEHLEQNFAHDGIKIVSPVKSNNSSNSKIVSVSSKINPMSWNSETRFGALVAMSYELSKTRHLRFTPLKSISSEHNNTEKVLFRDLTEISDGTYHILSNPFAAQPAPNRVTREISRSFSNSNGLYHISDSSIPFGFSMSSVVVVEGHVLLDPAILTMTKQSTTTASMGNGKAVKTLNSHSSQMYQPISNKPLVISNTDSKESEHLLKKQYMSELLSESNLITIQLPLSIIRMGKVETDRGIEEEDPHTGTLDAILNALNFHSFNYTQRSPHGSPHKDSFDDVDHSFSFPKNSSSSDKFSSQPPVVIELNCMILGAKLVMAKID